MSTLLFRPESRNPVAFPVSFVTGFFDSAEFILSERHGSNGLRLE